MSKAFVTTQALARRVEGAEAAFSHASIAAFTTRWPERAPHAEWIGGGCAVFTGVGSLLNKAIGVGLEGSLGSTEVDRLEQFFTSRGTTGIVELCPLADPSVVSALADRGFHVVQFEQALARPIDRGEGPASMPPGIVVREIGGDGLARWTAVVAEGFGQGGDEFHSLLGGLAETSRTRCFIAECDGQPAGGAGIRIDGGVGLVFGTATLPAFRSRGIQQALVDVCVFAARVADADLVTTTTAPGSTSQRNFERRGFHVLYTRTIFAKSPGGCAP